jgi:hypothetical protein
MKRIGFLVAAFVALAGCLPEASPWVRPSPDAVRLAVVGDSQVYLLQHAVAGDDTHRMTDFFTSRGYAYSESSEIGAATGDLKSFAGKGIAGWHDQAPQILVEALGTNDLDAQSGTPNVTLDIAERNLTTYLDQLPDTCVVLVEIPQTTPWRLDEYGPAWDAFLADQAAQRAGVVVSWAAPLSQHLTGYDAWVGRDQVHQTGTGKIAFLAAIADGVSRCPVGSP